MQALPPKYVKSVMVTNNFADDVLHVVGTFKSGETKELALPHGATVIVKRKIDQGDWKSVDPVINVTVKYSAEGGVVTSQDVSSDGGVKRFALTIRKDANGNAHNQLLES